MKAFKILVLNLVGMASALAQTAVPAVNQTATSAANTAAPSMAHPGGGLMEMVWMLAAFIFIFYFLLIRPQSKRAKEQRQMWEKMAKGDEVTTAAGLVGKIVSISNDFIVLNVADNVNLTFQKNAVTTVLPKGTLKNITE